MMHLFLAGFSNLLMMKYGIDSSKGIFKMKQDKLREQELTITLIRSIHSSIQSF